MRRRGKTPRSGGLFYCATMLLLVLMPVASLAAPYAAVVMDARTGKVLHARNADTRLHPASLTKMMTLYITFEAIKHGEISLDTKIRVSRNAAAEPPSKLGLKAGQKIKLRYCIRAAAVKSANDCATAIGEAISGSEARFARRMNRTAKALGMTRTTFKNANGLTEKGHLSTARDMTILGRHLIYDFPEYYNLFSRQSTNAGLREVSNTNRRLLASYRGADGIKTGYTRAAGFNLVASAERGNERVIATVFGGRSSASRNAKVAELLDLGFRRAPSKAPLRKPAKPVYAAAEPAKPAPGTSGKTIRLLTAVKKSLRPRTRPASDPEAPQPVLVAGLKNGIADALAEAQASPSPEPSDATTAAESAPAPAPPSLPPKARPTGLVLAAAPARSPAAGPARREVVAHVSTSGGRHWGINVGRYRSRFAAEKILLKTALNEMETLDGSLRRVIKRKTGFDANFMGLDRDTAERACRRLQARAVTCFMIGPG